MPFVRSLTPITILALGFESSREHKRLKIYHSDIPGVQADEYEESWKDDYFYPGRKYYSK